MYLFLLAVFLASRLAQWILADTVRNFLARRHPQTWRELLPSNWQERNSVVDFAWRRGDRELNDPDLTIRVRILNAVTLVSWAAWLLGVALLLAVLVVMIAWFA